MQIFDIYDAQGERTPVKVLGLTRAFRSRDGETLKRSFRLVYPRPATEQDMEDAAFAFSNQCSHEHDCCGCWQAAAYVHPTSRKKELRVNLRYFRNF